MGCFAVALGLVLIVLGTVLTMVGVGAILGVPIGLVGLLILIWGFARMTRGRPQ